MQSARQSVDQAIQKLKNNVEAACRNIKKHCSYFNLAQELSVMIQQLEHEKGMLRNVSAIQTANQFITSIRDLADTLSGQCMPSRSYAPRSIQPQGSFFSGLGMGSSKSTAEQQRQPAATTTQQPVGTDGDGSRSGERGRQWSCVTCTLVNESSDKNCKVCRSPNRQEKKKDKNFLSKLKFW
jgi:hypothetical protein